MSLCECGCGDEVSLGRQFIHGHNRRGKIVSKETKQRMSDVHKDKLCTEETKRKMSEAHRGKTKSEETKRKMGNARRGKVLSDKICEINRNAQKVYNHEHPEKAKQHSIDVTEFYMIMENRILASCKSFGIEREDWMGFAPDHRSYITPISQCIKLNECFNNSHGHHVLSNVIIYIPRELHIHIQHNIKTSENMNVINTLAFQYLNGYYNG